MTLVVSGIGVLTPGQLGAAEEGWFDYRRELGPRGYKYLPPASRYLLAATKRALADSGQSPESVPDEARAAAVGTNSAASALHAEMDATVIGTNASALSPAIAPFFSINLFGSRLATEHGLKGFNLTLTSPRVAGLEAVQHGARSVGLGRASWLLAGAAEAALDPAEPGADSSETGAVALVFEQADAVSARDGKAYGRCRARTSFLPPDRAGPELAAELVRGALAAFGLTTDRMPPVRAVLDDSPVGDAFAAVLTGAVTRVEAGAGCLEPMVQVADALAGLPEDGSAEQLVGVAAAQGNVAFALLTS